MGKEGLHFRLEDFTSFPMAQLKIKLAFLHCREFVKKNPHFSILRVLLLLCSLHVVQAIGLIRFRMISIRNKNICLKKRLKIRVNLMLRCDNYLCLFLNLFLMQGVKDRPHPQVSIYIYFYFLIRGDNYAKDQSYT